MSGVVVMHGRQVLQTEIPEEIIENPGVFCHDCGNKARVLISELSNLGVSWNPAIVTTPVYSWFWCGNCDVGA